MATDVQKLNEDVWDIIFGKVKNSVVFIDDNAAECLHWNGGVMKLFNAGADAVKEFSPVESGSPKQTRCMFITCSPLLGKIRYTMNAILQASSFSSCVAVTGAGKKVHSMAFTLFDDGVSQVQDPFAMIEAEIKDVMRLQVRDSEKALDVEVLYLPLFAINFGGEKNHILLTPPFLNLFPYFQTDASKSSKSAKTHPGKKGPHANQPNAILDDSSLPKDTRLAMVHLADSLHYLLNKISGRTEVYSLGHYSNLIAGEISRRKAESWSHLSVHGGDVALDASLILVDRTLDVATPCSHGSSALLDRIMASLPRLPGHTTDVAIDTTPLRHPKKAGVNVVGYPVGSLATASVPGEKTTGQGELLDLLAGGRRQKEIILGLHRQIVSAAISSKVRTAAPKAERITPKVIEGLVEEFAGHPTAVQSYGTLLQHSLCVSQALAHPVSQMFDYMSGAEKVLLQSLSLEDGKSPCTTEKTKEILSQVEMMIRSRHDRGFTMNELLALLVHLFALPLATIDYSSLKTVIQEAFEDDYNDENRKDFSAKDASVDVSHIFKVLESVSKARDNLKKYRTLYSQEYSQRTVTLRPLLAQLMIDVLNPTITPVPDLVCMSSVAGHSAGITGLLRSSLGHLMSTARPTPPGEAKLVIVFVIGGITGEEVRLIRETLWSVKDKAALAAAPKTVVVGGTQILSPDEVVKYLLAADC
ncbi:sec1 family domain-containing protein 2-like [Ischnura elegans]|uniref:sec1 family domain-containing protein 2-like n=1 Tax=Ischnura elegans TaxID=197161 RepID=UPI001ED866E6|nr:sec1 family domain-containing protein 2-like [Ischnura elegans]